MRVRGSEAVIDGEWARSVGLLFGNLPAHLHQQLQNTISLSLQEFTHFSGVRIGGDNGVRGGQFDEFQKTKLTKGPFSLEAYVQRLLNQVVPHCVNMNSARCLGHMTGGVPPFVRLLGELVLTLNQNMVKEEASGNFTWLERQTLAILNRLVFDQTEQFYCEHAQAPESTLGIMAADGTIANITALWIARNEALSANNGCGGPEADGLAAALEHHGYSGAVIIGSRLMHYSIEKAASLLGLGSRQVIKIEVDGRSKLDLKMLRARVAECGAQRRRVLAIVGTAGTTDCGSIDPLMEMAVIARESGIHFHVDAAWGTPLLFSHRYRRLLAGIEHADSVSLDGHKQLHLPAGANALLLRNPAAARVIEKEANYMLHQGSGDLGKRSLEGSRGAAVLFLHAALQIIGPKGYEALIDHTIGMARGLAAQLSASQEFELLAEPETNIVLYRYLPPSCRRPSRTGRLSRADLRCVNVCNERLQKAQAKMGRALVSRTTLLNPPHDPVPAVALRAIITNPFTDRTDLEGVLKEQVELGDSISKQIARTKDSASHE